METLRCVHEPTSIHKQDTLCSEHSPVPRIFILQPMPIDYSGNGIGRMEIGWQFAGQIYLDQTSGHWAQKMCWDILKSVWMGDLLTSTKTTFLCSADILIALPSKWCFFFPWWVSSPGTFTFKMGSENPWHLFGKRPTAHLAASIDRVHSGWLAVCLIVSHSRGFVLAFPRWLMVAKISSATSEGLY